MEFEWDPAKNLRNFAKHGVYFEDAVDVFEDPDELTEAARMVDEEARSKTIGRITPTSILLVVHTARESVGGLPMTRIISARPASRSERSRYERAKP